MIRRPLKRGSSASFLCIGAGILEDLSGTDELRPRATYSLSAIPTIQALALIGRHCAGDRSLAFECGERQLLDPPIVCSRLLAAIRILF